MKTAEEKAREYADETYPNADSNDYSRTTAEEWDACYDGYVEGYNEAMRWRDPKEELPIDSCDVLVKTDEGRYYACYFCLEREGFFHEYCRLQGVIGWRSIE